MRTKTYMAIGHRGTTLHDLGPFPRKAMLERLGRRNAHKIYVDRAGKAVHVGYIVAEEWFTLHEVIPFEQHS